jgi:hypothetical protein
MQMEWTKLELKWSGYDLSKISRLFLYQKNHFPELIIIPGLRVIISNNSGFNLQR